MGRMRSSLPLMGIGNQQTPSMRSHSSCDSSLPLMGIGNNASQFRGVDDVQHSLPLMGIGN